MPPLQTKVSWTLVHQEAADWSSTYAFGLVSDITDTTKEQLQKIIPSYFEEGLTQGQLKQKLMNDVTQALGPVRAEMIAVTEVTRAATMGELEIAKQLEQQGIKLVPFWATNMDDLVCNLCGPKDGKEIKDGRFPPEHPRCRCWTNHQLPKGKERVGPTSRVLDSFSSGSGKLSKIYMDQAEEWYAKAHGDGGLPKMNVKTFSKSNDINGRFTNWKSLIELNTRGDNPILTFFHEIGHLIDFYIGGEHGILYGTSRITKGMLGGLLKEGSEMAKTFESLMAAIKESAPAQKLFKMLANPGSYNKLYVQAGRFQALKADVKFLEYLTNDKEFFARAYAQYVATKSGYTQGLETCAKLSGKTQFYPTMWTAEEFAPIFEAFDLLFTLMGWLW